MAGLVREMNCYYSNLIEGHKIVPRDIERSITGKAATVSVEIIKLGLDQGYFVGSVTTNMSQRIGSPLVHLPPPVTFNLSQLGRNTSDDFMVDNSVGEQ